MHRFFYPQAGFSCPQIVLTDKAEIHHLCDVLRLKKDDLIFVFNEKNEEAQGKILSITPQEVIIQIQKVRSGSIKLPRIILACALPKKGKFELIIEKVTELGVDEIIPMVTKRTEFFLEGKRLEQKLARFKTVALNAAKQCQRTSIPAIHPITSFKDALVLLTKTSTVFIPSLLLERKNILKALQNISRPEKISFLIGPEGDFTPEEYKEAQKMGCIPVSLGETILKVETAAICAIACADIFYER